MKLMFGEDGYAISRRKVAEACGIPYDMLFSHPSLDGIDRMQSLIKYQGPMVSAHELFRVRNWKL